jgi:CRP-like cAMP-binding protein
MTNYIDILKNTNLFVGINTEEIKEVLPCLQNRLHNISRGDYVFRTGDTIKNMYVILEGTIHIISEDFWGNKSILSEETKTSIFGESYACAGNQVSKVSAYATKDSKILSLDPEKILKTCTKNCSFHTKLITNLVQILANKNEKLNEKITYMAERTTKRKLLSYFSDCSLESNSSSFTVPFNRQELADFLSVDRSAMSNELSKLHEEGIIDYNKNHFVLNQKDSFE